MALNPALAALVLAVLAGLFALAAAPAALALEVPRLTDRVMDTADMLSPETETWLRDYLAGLERTDSTQVAVLTIPSLEGENLEEYSVRVAQAWGLGRKDFDNGALVLLSRDDRAVRIEVGYGLEGELTDLLAGRIVDNAMIPHFAQGDIDGGVVAGVTAIADAVRGQYEAPPGTPGAPEGRGGGSFLGLLAFVLLLASQLGRASRLLGGLAGGLLMYFAGGSLFGAGLVGSLFLGFFGFMAGLVIASIFGRGPRGPRGPGGMGGRRRPPPVIFLPGRGGFGGGFGGGGFSGGGGGFGGGGASGRW